MPEEYITKSYFESYLDEKLDEKLNAKFDAFAIMLNAEFRRIDERFQAVDERFDKMDERFDRMDQRFDRLEFVVLQDHDRRIEKLEDSTRVIKTKLSLA